MRIAVWVLAAMVLLGACGDGSDPGPVVEGTEIARATTTTTIPPAPHLESTSTVPVELLPPTQIDRSGGSGTSTAGGPPENKLSWEGQRFDVGVIKKVAETNGRWVLAFDREDLVDAQGTRSGKRLTSNPFDTSAVRGNPPVLRNGARTLSFFNVSPDAPVNILTPVCDGGPGGVGETVPDLATYGVGNNVIDALTFDTSGQVTLIQLTHTC